jgi:citrate lyase subunit beta/citryl-CoA lyase
MPGLDPDLRRTWLFGPGADAVAHNAMLDSGSDAIILDLEDFTPPQRRAEARELLAGFVQGCRNHGCLAAIRINGLETEGMADLAAAMKTGPDAIVYPMADRAAQMHALDSGITYWESAFAFESGSVEIVPVCETALGVADLRSIAASSERIRCAILGSEDLANDLCAERGQEAIELDYARRRFLLECRAAGIEPIDAPYTFTDVDGAEREAHSSRRLGYRCKSLVRSDHAKALNAVFTPGFDEVERARAVVESFEAARTRGEERVLIDGLWVEVPTYRNARRLIERARRLGVTE